MYQKLCQNGRVPKSLSPTILLGAVAFDTFLFDLLSKLAAQNFLTTPQAIWPGLTLSLTQNPALAFGLPLSRPLLLLGSLLAIVGLFWLWLREVRQDVWPTWLGFGLLFGGGAGNLYERLWVGHVTDFVALGPIPNFNLADVALTCGALLLFFYQRRVFVR